MNFLVPEFVLEQCDDEVRTAFDGYVDQLKLLGYSVQLIQPSLPGATWRC